MSVTGIVRNLGRGLEGAVNAASTLANARQAVPGFSEYYDRKDRSRVHLGERFESRIIDIRTYAPEDCVFCVMCYSTSMDDLQTIRATLFRQGVEHACRKSYEGKDLIRGYQGILLADVYNDGREVAELSLKVRCEQVDFVIPLTG